ncbi:MAG: beta-propeller domain-containing protein [Phycisphaerae bacterium]|nr:beta-propeller domain-containing protein [Phycisphaerae bacterium]
MRRLWIIAVVGLAFVLSGASCPLYHPRTAKPRIAGLKGFGSAEELRQFLVDQANERLSGTGQSYGTGDPLFDLFFGWGGMASAPTAELSNADTGGRSEGATTSHSSTNIQEEGVDESDVVKCDEETIYWLRGDTIHVCRAYPATQLAELATVKLDSTGESLYLRGHQLIALSSRWSYGYYRYGWGVFAAEAEAPTPGGTSSTDSSSLVGGSWNDGGQVTVSIIDVSDPAHPTTTATAKFEGQLASSRMIDNHLYLVVTTTPRLPDNPVPLTLEGMTLDEWLPDYEITISGGATQIGDMISWQGAFRPEVGDGYNITTVATLDVDNPTGGFASTAITADAGTIYASTAALYVTDTQYDWYMGGSRTDTIVHKLAFTQTGTDYIASGMVPGRPLNQYSLGEYDGHLRIATNQDEWSIDGAGLKNGIYVMKETGTTLDIVGRIDDIAVGEQIYAARFIGPRGFLVTFKRIDPLFTVDLSNPTNPRIVGELKVPGYSDHLQLLDQNHILAIGKDAQDTGSFAWVQGVQLSMFDVSNLANPQLMFKEIIGGRGTHSEANNNPKAFIYYEPDESGPGYLTFPIDLYSTGTTGPEWGTHQFTGILVYRVDPQTGFSRLGSISTLPEGKSPNGCNWYYYGATRGLFIGENVYAVSDLGVKAAGLSSLGTLSGSVSFTGASAFEDCYYDDLPEILPAVSEGLR